MAGFGVNKNVCTSKPACFLSINASSPTNLPADSGPRSARSRNDQFVSIRGSLLQSAWLEELNRSKSAARAMGLNARYKALAAR